MRTFQHIIDTKAVKQVLNNIPEHCVIRELTERDYGIDLMLEIFTEDGENSQGHQNYSSTGHICYFQVKGTETPLEIKNETITYQIEKKALLYIEKFATPFILLRVCTAKGHERIAFIWLQRYIADVLDFDRPNWRNVDQDSFSIKIPAGNTLSRFSKIEQIAARIKYLEELADFFEIWDELKIFFSNCIINSTLDPQYFAHIRKKLSRICNLHTLFKYNYCCIDENSIVELREYINEIERGLKKPNDMEDFPEYHNLDLLASSTFSIKFIENLTAENDSDTVY